LESGEANMASLIKVKRSNSTGVKPTGLSAGELAINTFDKVLYSSDGTTVFELSKGGGLANTNSFIKSQLANTNAFIATKVNTTTFNSALANTNSFIKSQLANTNTFIATKADSTNPTTSGVLAHTGRATISTNLNVSGNTVISKLVANGSVGTAGFVLKSTGSGVYWDAQTVTGVSTATFNAALANTNSFIATKVNTTTFNSALANTNSFIKSQLANTNSFIATKVNTTTFNSALANTNTFIATKTSTTTFNSALANTNSFIKSQLANTNTFIATKVNTTTFNSALANTNTFIATKTNSASPTTSGVFAHTGRATISTNLAVTANTSIGGNLSVTGNLLVSGTQTFLDSTTVSIGDNMIKVANNNVADIIDIGLYSRYVSSGVKYSGMIRDASDGVFKFFYGLTTEPDQTINFGNTTQAEIDAIIDGGTFS